MKRDRNDAHLVDPQALGQSPDEVLGDHIVHLSRRGNGSRVAQSPHSFHLHSCIIVDEYVGELLDETGLDALLQLVSVASSQVREYPGDFLADGTLRMLKSSAQGWQQSLVDDVLSLSIISCGQITKDANDRNLHRHNVAVDQDE